jgi:hypothetical protein
MLPARDAAAAPAAASSSVPSAAAGLAGAASVAGIAGAAGAIRGAVRGVAGGFKHAAKKNARTRSTCEHGVRDSEQHAERADEVRVSMGLKQVGTIKQTEYLRAWYLRAWCARQ